MPPSRYIPFIAIPYSRSNAEMSQLDAKKKPIANPMNAISILKILSVPMKSLTNAA